MARSSLQWESRGAELTDPLQPITAVVGDVDDGSRLDVLVGSLDSVGSRAEAQRLIAAERVLVNGAPATKRHIVRTGDEVAVLPIAREAPELRPESVPIEVRYEDEHLLVVDKPAGIVTHPSRGHDSGTVVHGLLGHGISGGAEPFRPGIVHRLDRDTSGLLVVAKNERIHRALQALLRDRRVDRRYTVLVHGTFPPALTVTQPIGRDRRNRLRMSVNSDTPRDAVTRFRTLATFDGYSLLEARLETGRTHQIRVHLEFSGYPVVGDPVYARGRRNPWGLRRQFLHAGRLEFPHPATGDQVVVESRLPEDLQRILDDLEAGTRSTP